MQYDVNKISVVPIASDIARKLVVTNHYMKTFPSGAKLFFAVKHEGSNLCKGVAVFGRSTSTKNKTNLFHGLVKEDEIIEMQRLWISDELGANAESKTLSIICDIIKKNYKKIKVIWTYAGGCKNDCGIVYQSSGFMFLGSEPCNDFYLTKDGQYKNIINALRFGKGGKEKDKNKIALKLYGEGEFIQSQRHYYFYPICKAVRRKMQKFTKPFPKNSANFRKDQKWIGAGQGDACKSPGSTPGRSTNSECASSVVSSTSSFQDEGGGAIPTDALQLTATDKKFLNG